MKDKALFRYLLSAYLRKLLDRHPIFCYNYLYYKKHCGKEAETEQRGVRNLARVISPEIEYRRMTEESVAKLVISLSLPTVMSQMITSIYNMADTFFVTRLGDSAVGAVAIVYALQSIIQAVGFGLAMGAGSLVSRRLGEKDDDGACKYASCAFFSALLLGLLLTVGGLINLRGLLRLFGSTETILPYATEYAFIILLGAPLMCASFVLNNILRSEGKATFSMLGLTAGGVLNIILDPIFIFGAGMGVSGAALATVISQSISFVILLSFYLTGKSIVKLSPRYVSRRIGDYGLIVKTGLPTVFRQGLGSLATTLLNVQVKVYGDAAIAAVGIANKVYMLLRSFVLGIGHGFQPVAGYNYGAGKPRRVKKAFWVATALGTGVSITAALVLILFSEPIIQLFRPETAEVVRVGSRMLVYVSIALPFLGYSTYVNQLYQSLGYVKGATVLASCRQGIFFVPLIFLLPLLLKLDGILLTQPLSDLLTFLISIPFNILFLRRVLSDDGPCVQKQNAERYHI